jgi:hypothetical protein
MSDPQAPLKNFEKKHDFLVAIDSDGCAFDSMEIKHKECFIPNIIKYWNPSVSSTSASISSDASRVTTASLTVPVTCFSFCLAAAVACARACWM